MFLEQKTWKNNGRRGCLLSPVRVNYGSCLNVALKAWAVESNIKEQEVPRRLLDALDWVLLVSTLVQVPTLQFRQ